MTAPMREPDYDPVSEEITELLHQPMTPMVEEFAWIHLRAYRDEALATARSRFARERKEERIMAARFRLRDRLRSLLAWAKASGNV